MADNKSEGRKKTAFELEAEKPERGVIRQLWGFVSEGGRWWLIPIIIALLLFGILAVLSTTGAGVFIYPLF